MAGFCVVLLSWHARVPPGEHLSGFFQGDMPTYVCYAREAAASPTTLLYANPWDIRAEPARRMLNLPISMLGWGLLAGLGPAAVAMSARAIFGVLMYAALAWLLAGLFRERRWFWAAFIVVGLGGGLAWVSAVPALGGGWPAVHAHVNAAEAQYHWWFLSTYRNLLYPLECAYHAIVFAQLGALVRRRYGLATGLLALAAASNPFPFIQMLGVQVAALAFAWVAGRSSACEAREAFERRGLLASTVGTVAVAGAGALFYRVWIPGDPVLAGVVAAHVHAYPAPLSLVSAAWGYGLAWLGPVGLLVDGGFRRALRERGAAAVVVLAFGAWTLTLVSNSRNPLGLSFMPMHFSRGYAHMALWVITLWWLGSLARRFGPRRRAVAVGVPALAATLVLVALPDSAVFTHEMYAVPPHAPSIRWSSEQQAVYAWLEHLPGPPRHVLATDWSTGREVCALTRHRSAIGTDLITPRYDERLAELRQFSADPRHEPPLVRWADVLLVPGHDLGWIARMRRAPGWRRAVCNGALCAFERVDEDRARPRE
ncbi:MAG: hypothetical protein KC543_02955 [Myxococcales bacterium]|nr:hypothetical protein [Myxococcales bacterium]